MCVSGIRIVVIRLLPKQRTGVRFPYPAHNMTKKLLVILALAGVFITISAKLLSKETCVKRLEVEGEIQCVLQVSLGHEG